MQLLIIKSIDLEHDPEYALLGKGQLQDTFTQATWKEVQSKARGRKVVILLDSSEVILTSVSIPSTNKKQLIKAIPYALEDTLAEDIEDLHFAVYQDKDSIDNNSQVAVINRNELINTLNILKSHRITVTYAIPELLTQKIDDDAWCITYEKQNNNISANVRLDKFNGFSCDLEMLELFLPSSEEDHPSHIYSNTKSTNFPKPIRTITSTAINPDLIEFDNIKDALNLNLRDSLVYSSQQSSSINWKAWRPPAVLAGVVAALWVGIFFWEIYSLQNQSKQIGSQIISVYKDTFPNGRVQDPSGQMTVALRQLKEQTGQSSDSPLPLIADIAPLLQTYKDLPLSNIRYQENQLTMTLESPNLTRLEAFKKDAAEKSKLKVDITDSTTTANKVKAVIRISPLEQGNS